MLSVFAKNARKQTALGVFLGGMQQLSGIDGVLYVSVLGLGFDELESDKEVVCTASVPVCWSYQ